MCFKFLEIRKHWDDLRQHISLKWWHEFSEHFCTHDFKIFPDETKKWNKRTCQAALREAFTRLLVCNSVTTKSDSSSFLYTKKHFFLSSMSVLIDPYGHAAPDHMALSALLRAFGWEIAPSADEGGRLCHSYGGQMAPGHVQKRLPAYSAGFWLILW